MNKPMLQKLKDHLASITKEQFRQQWAEVEALGLEGPTMEDFILSFSAPKIVSEIKVITDSSAFETVSEEVVVPEAGEYSYALAA